MKPFALYKSGLRRSKSGDVDSYPGRSPTLRIGGASPDGPVAKVWPRDSQLH